MQFTINGKLIEVGGVCLDFQLPMFENLPGSGQFQDAFRKLRDFAQDLNVVLQNMGDTIISQAADVGGDLTWIERLVQGQGVPAQHKAKLGNIAQANYLVHINEFKGKGAAPPDTVPLGTAPAGAHQEVLTGALTDPALHWVGQTRGYAARPFTVTTPWLTYDAATDVLAHGTTAAGSSMPMTVQSGTSFVNALERDAQNHIIKAYYTAAPGGTSYTALAPWLVLVGTEFQHASTTAGTLATSSSSVVNGVEVDAMYHLIDVTWTAAGMQAASAPWLSLSGTTIQHSTSANTAGCNSYGSADSSRFFLSRLSYDAMYHIMAAESGSVTGDGTWIGINASGPHGVEVYHITAGGATGGSYEAGGGSAVKGVIYDNAHHVIGITQVTI